MAVHLARPRFNYSGRALAIIEADRIIAADTGAGVPGTANHERRFVVR